MFNLQKIIIGLILLSSSTFCCAQWPKNLGKIKTTVRPPKPPPPIIGIIGTSGFTSPKVKGPSIIPETKKEITANPFKSSNSVIQHHQTFQHTLDSLEAVRKKTNYERHKALTLFEYQRFRLSYNYRYFHSNDSDLIELAEKCAFYKLEKESNDCLEKYLNRYLFKPTKISEDIANYEEINKKYKTNKFETIIPQALIKAQGGLVYHIYLYRNELFTLKSNHQPDNPLYKLKDLKNEALVLHTLTEKYAKGQLDNTKLILKILEANTVEEQYVALENAAKSFINNVQDSTIVSCGECITDILIEYPYSHPQFALNLLNLFDNEEFERYTKNNLNLTFNLYLRALENNDERIEKYAKQGLFIDKTEFEKKFAQYYDALNDYIIEHPEEKTILKYLMELSDCKTDFLINTYINYFNHVNNESAIVNDYYLDEKFKNYRDAQIYISQLGDSITKKNGDSTLNLIFKLCSAETKMAYFSSANEGRKEIASLYNEITKDDNNCIIKSLFLDITLLHSVGLFYGEGKEKEAYDILKPMIEFIEEECIEPGNSELEVLNLIITYSNKLEKKRTAKKAQKLMNKLFPNNSMETSPNTTI